MSARAPLDRRGRRRVVVTGFGALTPIGSTLSELAAAMREGRSGIRRIEEWGAIEGLGTRLGGPVLGQKLISQPRKKVRTMGRVARLALTATARAVEGAGLSEEELRSGELGLAYGSTHGSSSAYEDYCRPLFGNNSLIGLPSTGYLRFMSHTCAANLALYYGITGRVITTCAACVSSSQAIGFGYEAIRAGQQEVMLTGGAEELHWTHAGVFDLMMATSGRYNDRPAQSPRPFDRDRDGLVIAEGAATVVLESLERAERRGAPILAEVVGFGTNCDGTHVTSPSATGMAQSMRLALADAGLEPGEVGYINAHATATDVGDLRESEAVMEVFGGATPISSTKGYMGHTLGACGAIEVGLCIAMMRDGFLAANRNLEAVDERCAPLDYVMGGPRALRPEVFMTNNFAFGGINTSILLRRWAE